MKKLTFLFFSLLTFYNVSAQTTSPQHLNPVSSIPQITESSAVSSYCVTSLGGTNFDISTVSITGTTLNNNLARANVVSSDGSYYTAYTAAGSNTCMLTSGATYLLSVTTQNYDIISAWVDYNQNGAFEASEWVQVSTYSASGVASSISLTIPAAALTGQTVLRIRSRSSGSSNGATDACSTFGSGCTEDYTISIASPTPSSPVCNFTAASTITTIGSLIQFSDLSAGVPTTWNWTFLGGTPATSSTKNPFVSYNANGIYNVKLVVQNALGKDSITKLAYVTVANSVNMPVTGSSSVTSCGIIIYDNGGKSTYSNSSNGVLTINAPTDGSAVKLQFSEFNTESYSDILTVYNGNSISAPVIGSFSGTTLPASITATNPTGSLTLKFASDGYNFGSGFVAQTSCVPLVLQSISSVAWSNNIDNNLNTYAQSRTLNYAVKNNDIIAATMYAKIYSKLNTESTYTLISTSSFVVNALSTSATKLYAISGVNAQATLDCKIELYNSANVLINSYDLTSTPALGGLRFESASEDILPSYCINGLLGNAFDISGVSINGTSLNNVDVRPVVKAFDGSYYTLFAPTATNTCTLISGQKYTLNVVTKNTDIVSAWIDYNHDLTFQTNEWVQVTTLSTVNSPSSVQISIPANAFIGQTRMRIRTNTYSLNGATNSCATFNYGCTEDYTITIAAPVLAKPVVDFSTTTTVVSLGTPIQYNDYTTGVPATWEWTFQGGSPVSSTIQNPTVTYTTAGKYSVKLVAKNSLGADSIVKTDYITIVNTVNVPATGSKTITACGITVYDNGGSANYSNSTNGILTINPSTAGSAVRLQFSEFSTESCCDALYVYNGTNTSAPLIGTYAGTQIPVAIIATNPTGALTLRFSADGSSNSTGFVAQASCVPLTSQYISASSWTSTVDNNYNDYAQARTFNFTVKNDDVVSKTLYAKIYNKLSTATEYTLFATTSNFVVSANSLSTPQSSVLTGFVSKGSYDVKVEIYNSANVLVYTYDLVSSVDLTNLKFESIADDGLSTYCLSNLGGGSFDISAVSISPTLMNNSSTRVAVRTIDGSYFTEFAAAANNTTTLFTGSTYTLNVTTKSADIISVWIDYNQDLLFQSNEWVQVATSSIPNTKASISIVIPTTALKGLTRMRIRSANAGALNGSTDPCTSFLSGCTEDYFITIADPVLAKPVVDFVASATSLPLGSSIQFSDLTTGIPSSWTWTFAGATPSSSTSKNPTVLYSTAGVYAVKLVAKNSLGTDSITKSGYITILNSINMPITGSNSITSCGITIYDDGGKSNYSNSVNGVLTINPVSAGTAVKLQFSEFNTESYSDVLTVYNGTSISAPLIGSFSGSTIPNSIRATNASGALTLRFSTDGSALYSGFAAQAVCVPLVLDYISTTTWTKNIDNNYNSYSQSRVLNILATNNNSVSAVYFAKVYYKLSTTGTYQLLNTTSSFRVAANSNSETILLNVSNFSMTGYYDFKIELYNSANVLLSTYDLNDNTALKSQAFESATNDGLPYYCTSGLGGSPIDILLVSIPNTTLNNTTVRPITEAYVSYPATGSFTGTIGLGSYNTINVQTANNDIVSVWIDFDHSGTFDASEWTQVSTNTNSTTASATIYVPLNSLTGPTRLRVRTRNAGTSNYSTDACTPFVTGCTEDYVLNIDKPSGMSEYTLSELKIYPNPVINDLNISIPGFTNGTLTISDMVGRIVLSRNISGELITENVSTLSKGMYIVNVKMNNGASVRKQVMIQN